MYLLGLPNKLGQLGFLALNHVHHVLKAEEEAPPHAAVLKRYIASQSFKRTKAFIKVTLGWRTLVTKVTVTLTVTVTVTRPAEKFP